MVGHQVVGIDFIVTLPVVLGKNDKESFVIIIIREDILLIDASYYDVIDFAFTFYSGYPWHINSPTDSL